MRKEHNWRIYSSLHLNLGASNSNVRSLCMSVLWLFPKKVQCQVLALEMYRRKLLVWLLCCVRHWEGTRVNYYNSEQHAGYSLLSISVSGAWAFLLYQSRCIALEPGTVQCWVVRMSETSAWSHQAGRNRTSSKQVHMLSCSRAPDLVYMQHQMQSTHKSE